MSRVVWRWEEKDFGFRFRTGVGRSAEEYYQAAAESQFYIVPKGQRKFPKKRADELTRLFRAPDTPQVIPSPWRKYDHDWDFITTDDGICLNYAGCLDREELHRREDEGVQRAMELITRQVERPVPAALTLRLICEVHVQLLGAIYPFAGRWRRVALHKGEGCTKWPLPPGGIEPLIEVFERDVLARSPFLSSEDDAVFSYASELMNELLAIHPFREGNGRTAFILGNMILMQNDMLPLTTYERRADQKRYFAACEEGRVRKNYEPLAVLIKNWQDQALVAWRETHG